MTTTLAAAAHPPRRRRMDRVVVDPASMDVAPSDIAQRAYALFLARGGTHGRDVEDWLTAETELRRDLGLSAVV